MPLEQGHLLINNAVFQKIYKRLNRPTCILDLFLVSTLICATIAYLASDRTILIAEGGYRVFLIRFSFFLELILITNGLWLLLAGINQTVIKSKWITKINIPLFIISNLIGLHIIAADAIHFAMFGAHWDISAILTFIDGVEHKSAPLNLSVAEILTNIGVISLFYFSLIILIKLTTPITKRIESHRSAFPLMLLIGCIFALIGLQQNIPSNWHSQQLQKGIPWIQFIKEPTNFVIEHDELSSLKAIKSQQREYLASIRNKISALPDTITAKHTPNILVVHIEALRSDMLTENNMPNLYKFSQDKAESLSNHYSSSNNTVGSIFGIVTGLTGPLYQFFRESPFKPASIDILQKLGYQLTKYNTVASTYQNADTLIFPEFRSEDFFTSSMIERETSMIDEYIKHTAVLDKSKPRFDYLVINTTHFPYSHTEKEEVFSPSINLEGMSMRAESIQYLNENKKRVKNRFQNSVLFVDNQLKRLLDGLEENGFLSDSNDNIVIIVGDHGQEFWEHNRFSHSWSFVDEQTQVVAVMRLPEKLSTQYTYSSHSDFFPTIFSYMQVDTSIDSLMNGKDLSQYQPEKDFVSIAMGAVNNQKQNKEAVVGKHLKIEYSVAPKLKINAIVSDDDDKIDYQQKISAVYQLLLSSINSSTQSL